jgi:hypothetical protein
MTTPYKFDDALTAAEKEWSSLSGGKGNYYKVAEGKNRVRILSPLYPFASHFTSKTTPPITCVGKEDCAECKKMVKDKDGNEKENTPGVKFSCYVLDYKDNIIKLAQFPLTIFLALRDLQNDPEWSFNELPMPYDITINAEGAGQPTVKYGVVASPKKEPISKEVEVKLSKLHTPDQINKAKVIKQKKLLGLVEAESEDKVEYPKEEINPDDIPF